MSGSRSMLFSSRSVACSEVAAMAPTYPAVSARDKRMADLSDTDRPEPVRSPRCGVQFDGDGTWSAWRGAILLASGVPTAAAAWDVIDRAALVRLPAPPMRLPNGSRRWRGDRA